MTIVAPTGQSIQSLYGRYRDGLFIVNRKYQRKLVWTIEEKKKLIDSIMSGFPIPLFLFAEKDFDKKKRYEIIDGMQRLHTLFSFIEQSFSINNQYFDIKQFARARVEEENGKFKEKIDVKYLSSKDCSNFLDYQLAVTVYQNSDENSINEIFHRINSFGRMLSSQEKRHAIVESNFSELVRKISTEIRGDTSKEELFLYEMPEISIDSNQSKVGYGVKADDVFWIKQGILTTTLLRASEDEQFIADILATILGNEPFASSREALDRLYDPNNEIHIKISSSLSVYGVDKIKTNVLSVFSYLYSSLSNISDDKYYLRSVLSTGKDNRNPIKTEFYALFMALFELIVIEEMTPIDNSVYEAVKNLSGKMIKNTHYVTTEDRKQNINLTIGLLRPKFFKKEPSLLGQGAGLYIELQNSLRRSKVETPRYEFKQGVLRLDGSNQCDMDVYKKIINTICGIANISYNEKEDSAGFIYLGIADSEADANKIKVLHGINNITNIDGKFVVGIDREAKIIGKNIDNYLKKLVSEIKNSELTDPLKTQVIHKIDAINFYDLTVIRIRIPRQNSCSYVGNKLYHRTGNCTSEASAREATVISQSFSSNSNFQK